MAKFKVGDLVSDGIGVYKITKVDPFMGYSWKFVRGTKDMSHSQGGMFSWADSVMKISNSVVANAKFKIGDTVIAPGSSDLRKIAKVFTEDGKNYYKLVGGIGAFEESTLKKKTNSVVANAKFKVGDRVNDSGTWGKIIEVVKKNARGEVIYGFAPESGPGKGFAYEILESKLSKNSVVANALGVAKNAIPQAGNITSKQLDQHAHDFVRSELEKIASQLRKSYDDIYRRWMQTGIAQGYVRAGGKVQDAENAIDDYMIRLSSAWNNLEHL